VVRITSKRLDIKDIRAMLKIKTNIKCIVFTNQVVNFI
jgi:hypothetical protein